MIDLRELPSRAIRESFTIAKLPVAFAGSRLASGEASSWPPYLLLETVESGVKSVAGRLLHDPSLTSEADDLKHRLMQLREASAKEVLARQQKASADAAADASLERNKQRRAAAREKSDVLKAKANADARKQKESVAREAASVRASVEEERRDEQSALHVQETVKQLAAVGAAQRAEQVAEEVLEEQALAEEKTKQLKKGT